MQGDLKVHYTIANKVPARRNYL